MPSEPSAAMSQFEKTKPISKTEDRKQKTAKSWQKIQPTFSTMVEKPLQIGTILKNKANLPYAKMNVKSFLKRDYDDFAALGQQKNKANSNLSWAQPALSAVEWVEWSQFISYWVLRDAYCEKEFEKWSKYSAFGRKLEAPLLSQG